MSDQALEQALLDAAHRYLRTFFVERDPEASAALASDRICGFGTGGDEKVYHLDYALQLYQRDVEQMPTPVHYTLHAIKAQVLSDSTGVVMGEMDWKLTILQQTVLMRGVRFSLVFQQENKRWRVIHKHLSQPSSAHGSDEAYPLKELESRTLVLERMVEERTRELRLAHAEMERLATFDALTKLYNRGKIDDILDLEIARCKRHPSDLSIILIDADHFKYINDAHGHDRGDQLLVALSELLIKRCRATDSVGRWGGEEFLIVCPNTDAQQAAALAEQLRAEVQRTPLAPGASLTLSLGVASVRPSDRREHLFKRADQALYGAKQLGRNRVALADD